MPKFTRRQGGADLKTNSYYNDPKYCGIYPFATSYIDCVLWAICRSGEIAEVPVTAYTSSNISKRKDIMKPIFTRNGYGHAKEWWNDTIWDKTIKADEVKLGDIVCYGSSWGGGYGHVRIVEKIDDNYFYCSGGNEDGKGLLNSIKYNIRIAKQNGGSSTGLMGYIHNPFITYEVDKVDYRELYEKEKIENERLKNTLSQIKGLCE